MKRLVLDEKLDTAAADKLRDAIVSAETDDIVADGAGVAVLGALCLELLMSARVLWTQNGKSFVLENPSEPLVENLVRFGVTPDHFEGSVG
ncbi:MAG: STAS domain-containing protein [Silicimonas sp.]|nr:STAS domain-containing protein [Silicimonas sp.]